MDPIPMPAGSPSCSPWDACRQVSLRWSSPSQKSLATAVASTYLLSSIFQILEKKMAKGVNKVFLLGNVGKDPEIRSTAGGMTVASFSLATADRQKDAQGNWADKTEWHNLVCFQRTAEVVRDYVK